MNSINQIWIQAAFISILMFVVYSESNYNGAGKAEKIDFQNINQSFSFFFEKTVKYNVEDKKLSINTTNTIDKFSNKKTKNRQQYLIIVVLSSIMTGVSARIIFIKNNRLKKKKDEKDHAEESSFDFCMNLSNELKTSITIIHELVDSLKNNIENDNKVRAQINLDIISRETENLQLHCDEILSSLSLKQENHYIQIVHDDIVSFIAKFFDTLIDRNSWYKNIELLFLPSEYDIWMDFSPDYMRIILQNIIHDAFERCEWHNRIEIRISKNESENLCSIYISDNAKSDSGNNLVIRKLREFAKKNDPMIIDNSNIKLFLAKQLIEKIGGLLQVKSFSNKGTTIELSLPITHRAKFSEINRIDINNYSKIPMFEEIRKPQVVTRN